MDLSFARFQQYAQVTMLPPDLAVLLVGVAARQAASPTAIAQARIDRNWSNDSALLRAPGAFNRAVAGPLSGTARIALRKL